MPKNLLSICVNFTLATQLGVPHKRIFTNHIAGANIIRPHPFNGDAGAHCAPYGITDADELPNPFTQMKPSR